MGEPADSLADVVQATVEQWLQERGGGMIGGYAMILSYYDADGTTCWATAYNDGQLPSATLGLLRFQTMAVEGQVREYLDRESD